MFKHSTSRLTRLPGCLNLMCKMRLSCNEETADPLTYLFMNHLWSILLELTNQRVRHYGATREINQLLVFATFESQYYILNHL